MTHLRLPKRAECCRESNLAVPLPAASTLTLYCAGCGALPCSAPGLSSQLGSLNSETSHKCNQPLSRGKSDLSEALNFCH